MLLKDDRRRGRSAGEFIFRNPNSPDLLVLMKDDRRRARSSGEFILETQIS